MPAIGAIGSPFLSGLMYWHLYGAEHGTFRAVRVLAVAVEAVELLWFERKEIADSPARSRGGRI